MNSNTNPSVQWLQDLKAQLGALWQSLNQLQADYDLAKANLNNLDANSTDPTIIQQRQQAISLVQEAEKALSAERQSLIGLQGQYQQASNACEAALRRIREEQDKAFNISRSAENVTKGVKELSEAYGSVLDVMSMCGIESQRLAAIQEKLNNIISITTAIQKTSALFSAQSAFQTQVVSRVTSAWGAAQTFLNKQLGLSVGLSKGLAAGGIGLLIAGIGILISYLQKLNAAKKEQAAINKQINNSVRDEVSKVEVLESVLKNSNNEYKTRKIALDKIKEILPSYNAMLTKEGKLIEDNTGSLKKYAQQLKNTALAQLYSKKLSEAEDNSNTWIKGLDNRQRGILLTRGKGLKPEEQLTYNLLEPIRKEWQDDVDYYKKALESVVAEKLKTEAPKEGTKSYYQDIVDRKNKEMEYHLPGSKTHNSLRNERDKAQKMVNLWNEKGNSDRKTNFADEIKALRERNEQDRKELSGYSGEDPLKIIQDEYDAKIILIKQKEQELFELNNNQALTGDNLALITSSYENAYNIRIAKEKQLAEEQKKEQEERKKELKTLLDSYQDYTDKRAATEKKFNDDIAKLQEAKKKAKERGDEKEEKQIDRSIAHATKEKGINLATMDMEQLKKTPQYAQAFENLKLTSEETLNSLLAQLATAKEEAAEVLSPEQLKGYNESIKKTWTILKKERQSERQNSIRRPERLKVPIFRLPKLLKNMPPPRKK